MAKTVRVRRERPSALSWAIALALTMLIVYLLTLDYSKPKAETAVFTKRVTQEVVFEEIKMYFAELGAYENAGLARIAAAHFADSGGAGCIYADTAGYHVIGAGYTSASDAERIAQRLSEQENVEGAVLSLSAPRAMLRIVAQESEINAIVRADRVLREQAAQVAELALKIDRNEISASAARTLLSIGRTDTLEASAALGKVSGAKESKVCAGMIELLDILAEELGKLIKSGHAASVFTGQLRLCHCSAVLRHIEFMKGLAP